MDWKRWNDSRQFRMPISLVEMSTGQKFELTERANVIGRGVHSNIVVEAPDVSRRHAMIRRSGGQFWLYDLGSANGSKRNGRRIGSSELLINGDEIAFGSQLFRFESDWDPQDTNGFSDDELVETMCEVKMIRPILFVSDVKGYSTMAEQLPADELASVMGKWYSACERILAEGGASILDFAGDSVFAFWEVAGEESCQAALKCAHDLLEFSSSLGSGFGSGVALNVGDVASGNMEGGDYRLVGDEVNLTFRIEGLTREVPGDVVFTRAFVDVSGLSSDQYQSYGKFAVKGRVEEVEVLSVVESKFEAGTAKVVPQPSNGE